MCGGISEEGPTIAFSAVSAKESRSAPLLERPVINAFFTLGTRMRAFRQKTSGSGYSPDAGRLGEDRLVGKRLVVNDLRN